MGAGAKIWGFEPTTKVWVPLRVDADGSIHVVGYVDKLDDIGDVNVPAPGDHDIIDWDAATGKWVKRALGDMGAHHDRHSYLGADELLSIMRLLSQRAIPFMHKNWADINGFTAAHTGSGGFTTGWSYATLYTGVTNDSEGIIYDSGGFYQAYAAYGYSWGTKVSIRQGTTQTIWIGLLDVPTAPSLTQPHIAFYVDTSGNLWASSGNGTNGTQTDTGIDITGSVTPFLSIYADNVGIYYYVDHVLKATHLLASSYYPNALSCQFTMYIKNATDAATREMYCYPLNMFAMFAY